MSRLSESPRERERSEVRYVRARKTENKKAMDILIKKKKRARNDENKE
jgi:hypothetical protein